MLQDKGISLQEGSLGGQVAGKEGRNPVQGDRAGVAPACLSSPGWPTLALTGL